MATSTATVYTTVYDLELRNKQAGQHWFDADTKRFFRSRIVDPVYPSADGTRVYFVSSEQYVDWRGNRERRLYTVRVMDWETGNVDTVGEFQGYSTSRAARKEAERLSKE